jgi:acyl-CoA thioesterase I
MIYTAIAFQLLAAAGSAMGNVPENRAGLARIDRLLAAGEQTVRVVCFGDSITGVYYHTGGRRAWTDMLGIALRRIHPKAKLKMFNAGISGHTTAQGLNRIQRDVLAKKPHLVVVMFGMNDVVGTPRAIYAANLWKIIRYCRGVGAEIVLCTPNSIYPEDARRPVPRLDAFCETVRGVAREMCVPLVDCYAAYEAIRAKAPVEWKLLMSETIHPNMHGHKVFAEEIAAVISGRRVSLADVRAVVPCVPHTLTLLAQCKPIKLIAMEPYDRIMPDVLQTLSPGCEVQLTPWPTRSKSLAEIEAWSKTVRNKKPDFVVVAVPAEALPENTERLIRSYSWVLNWSSPFGVATWDVIAVLPSVARPSDSPTDPVRSQLARRVVLGQDIGVVERSAGDNTPPEQLLLRWFRTQQARFKPPIVTTTPKPKP